MKALRILLLLGLVAMLVACAGRTPTPVVVEKAMVVKQTVVMEKPVEVQKIVEKQVTAGGSGAAAPAAGAARPAAATAQPLGTPGPGGASSGLSALADTGRMIIKQGSMALVVADTDEAIDKITLYAVQRGGYLVAMETTQDPQGYKTAKMALGVPVDQFENLQRQVRGVALRVTKDTATGVDVTDTYVDTQSRLANLEATQARIRTFLDQARTVEESLKVNAQLAEIEAQIGTVKGRLNFLAGRAAYSTLEVQLSTDRLTPTPTTTATPTPTPMRSPWQPGQTLGNAGGALVDVLQAVVDVAIWFFVFVLPVLSPLIVIAFIAWWRRRSRPRTPAATPPATPTPPEPQEPVQGA